MGAEKSPLFMSRFLSADLKRRFFKIEAVEHKENDQKKSDGDSPYHPYVSHHPKKRDTFEIPQKERRIPDRRKRPSDIADDKNKKNSMIGRDAVFIHSQPRADQHHRRARRAQYIRQNGAYQ